MVSHIKYFFKLKLQINVTPVSFFALSLITWMPVLIAVIVCEMSAKGISEIKEWWIGQGSTSQSHLFCEIQEINNL